MQAALSLGLVWQRRAETALALTHCVGSPTHRMRIWMNAGTDLSIADQDDL